jgi:hypothetical protein
MMIYYHVYTAVRRYRRYILKTHASVVHTKGGKDGTIADDVKLKTIRVSRVDLSWGWSTKRVWLVFLQLKQIQQRASFCLHCCGNFNEECI